MKNIVLLGSTGSVGRNVLEVVRAYPDRFRVTAISSNENVALLSEQAEEFKVGHAAIGNESLYKKLKEKVPGGAQVLA